MIQGCNCSTHVSGMRRHNVSSVLPKMYETSMISHLYQIFFRHDSHMITLGCVRYVPIVCPLGPVVNYVVP